MRQLQKFILIVVLSTVAHAQGSVLLVGGGSENYKDWSDAPYRWFVEHAPNKKILVLHYSTGSAWLEAYFKSFGAAAATSYVIASTAAANDSAAYKMITACDGLFLRGGDQWQYVNLWRGTLAAQAIRDVYKRGGVVGGTSAGEMILSEIVFDARSTSLEPRAALRAPLTARITLTDDFLALVPNVLVDSHFYERARIGRLPVMMTYYTTQPSRKINGIGVDYNTALAVGSNGIGQVMGAGTVTVLRSAPTSSAVVESGKPYSASGVLFDQLTAGSTVDLNTWSIVPGSTASVFTPVQVDAPPGVVMLDGGGGVGEWSAPVGSMKAFQQVLGSSADKIGIITSSASQTTALGIQTTAIGWGMQCVVIPIDETQKNNSTTAASISSCQAFVLVGNSIDSAGRLLAPGTSIGTAFRTRVAASTPLLFLGDDAMLVGSKAVGNLYQSVYGAYYGYLTLVDGIGVIAGIQVMPRVFESSDYYDNRTSGLLWNVGKSAAAYGLLLDNASFVTITHGHLTALGSTPVLIIDAHNARRADFPAFHDPGKANPRNNAALTGARFHAIRQGDGIAFNSGEVTGALTGPSVRTADAPPSFGMLHNYPNPFNPETTLRFYLSHAGNVTVKIYDILGREAAVLVDRYVDTGDHEVRWDGTDFAPGVYLARLEQRRNGISSTDSVKLILTK